MNKKYLNALLLGAMLTGSVGTFVSCKDYDDDISNLQSQIDATNVTLEKLQKLIDSGSVIESVTSTGSGLSFKMSDGNTYEVKNGANGKDGVNGADGKDGANGVDGKNAVVWTIGEDGYWYQDDVKTEYKAIGADGVNGADGTNGTDGKDGADGTDGKDGMDGKNGQYYVPNQATGFFEIWQDGKKVSDTEISWQASGMSAVLNGNTLTLAGVDGATSAVTLNLGTALGSVAFVPEAVSTDVPYATTANPFYHLATYLDETKYNATSLEFIKQSKFDKSNIVELPYRLNPTDAYVEGANLAFINRAVVTRATADKTNLLNVANKTVKDGSILVGATINASALAASSEYNIAALQVWAGTNPYTSDYVHVKSTAIDALLVNAKAAAKEQPKEYYNRTQSIEKGEADAFIKGFVGLNAAANLQMKYDQSIDLSKYVDLYSKEKEEFLTKLGFDGISYTFSLPAEYLANDQQETNQQWFVQLDGSVLKANATNLTTGLTPAIGRTPVVRVDAFMTNNAGDVRLVASAYIKVSITRNDPVIEEAEDKEAVNITIGEDKAYEYHALKAIATNVVKMPWEDINTALYGATGLNSQEFWNEFGGDNKEYEVKITSTSKTGSTYEVYKNTAVATDELVGEAKGISFTINLNETEVTTSNIEINVNNQVLTENTYKDVDGKGAEYVVTITIPANNSKVYGDFVLTQKFYVKEDCKPYTYNELYYMDSFNGVAGDYVMVKGQLKTTTWEMSSYIGEHFEIINEGSTKKDIFTYYNTVNNAQDIVFNITDTESKKVATITDNVIALKAAMTDEYEVVKVDYTVTLVNTEECDFKYNVIFINPFVGSYAKAVSLYGNAIGTRTVEVAPQVVVKDNDGEFIYSWDAETEELVLSEKASNTYKVAAPTVTYAFKETTAYKNLIGQLTDNASLSIDAATGTITWVNEGTSLVNSHVLTVVATVTFENLSEVEIEIPFTLSATK
ncbi:MAG: hypothetical protein IJ494_03220 [Bacteroides sp.]|nr:hypothetical protein [Bacteroides sp.]